jgi:hypothetical protein
MTHNCFLPPRYLVTRKSAGFEGQETREIALYCRLGPLRERKFAHRFL